MRNETGFFKLNFITFLIVWKYFQRVSACGGPREISNQPLERSVVNCRVRPRHATRVIKPPPPPHRLQPSYPLLVGASAPLEWRAPLKGFLIPHHLEMKSPPLYRAIHPPIEGAVTQFKRREGRGLMETLRRSGKPIICVMKIANSYRSTSSCCASEKSILTFILIGLLA